MKRARMRAGISQPGIARALGVSQATVSRLESGRLTATLEDLLTVAAVVRVPIESLLGRSPATARRNCWAGRPPSMHASRHLANGLSPELTDDFVAMGGSLRALRAAREGRQPLTASQAGVLLALGGTIPR
jgi:transcriptional regulator with XRE-family HTH domain